MGNEKGKKEARKSVDKNTNKKQRNIKTSGYKRLRGHLGSNIN